MKKIVPYFSLLPVIILSLWIVRPFFRPGFFETHDGEWAIVRLAEMVRINHIEYFYCSSYI